MPAGCCCRLVSLATFVILHVWLTGASLVCGHCERLLHPLCLQPPALSLDTMLPSSWECPSCGEPNQVRLLLLPPTLPPRAKMKLLNRHGTQETSGCTHKKTVREQTMTCHMRKENFRMYCVVGPCKYC